MSDHSTAGEPSSPQPRAQLLHPVLAEPPSRIALARHDITTVFAALTATGQVSQRDIAHLTGMSQPQVSEIVHGNRQVMAYDLLARICDALGVPRGWMGLAHTDALGALTSYPAGGDGDDGEDDDMRRRTVVLDALTAAVGVVAFDQDTLGRLASFLGNHGMPGRIGPADAEAVRQATAALRKLDHQYGGAAVHDAVNASARQFTRLLDADATPGVHRDLQIAVAHQHSLAGATAADAGMTDRARWHFHQGLTMAGASEDVPTVTWLYDDIGRMEIGAGEPNEALKWFQLASVRSEPWPVLRGLMAGCYAAMGQPKEARKQLAAAADTERATGGLAGQAGHVLLRLGELPGAVAHLESSLAGREHNPHDARARCVEYASLATAQLRAGQVAAGAASAERCLALASKLHSAVARGSLRPLWEVASLSRDSTCQDLAQRLRMVAAP